MGTKNATSTATQTLPPWVQSAYQGVLGQAQQTAQTPYSPYTGGFQPDQQTAFANLNNLQGSGNNSFQQANSAANSALTPSYQTVGNYMSPYIGNVVNATMQNMQEQNAQQQQGVIGNAISKGAFGGNRVGVAQGELARQQGLANNQTIAGLYNDAYQQALTANQGQQNIGLQGAQTLGQLGQTQSETGLNQANALLGAGTQQQQFNYQQYLNQQGFPYQQQQWLAGIAGGLGPSAGGTTTESKPQGNIISQLLGTILGGASLFNGPGGGSSPGGSKYGGVVPGYADGGAAHIPGQFPTISPDEKKNDGPNIADIAKIAMMFARDGGVVPRGYAVGGSPYANDNGQFGPIQFGRAPYANDNANFGSFIPQVAIGGGGGHFPTISADAQEDDPLSKYSDVLKGGASNIKNWLTPKADGGVVPGNFHWNNAQWLDANHHATPVMGQQGMDNLKWKYSGLHDIMKNLGGAQLNWRGRPESTNVDDRTRASGGVVPGYAKGGKPSAQDVSDMYGGIFGPSGFDMSGFDPSGFTPTVASDATSAINAAAPDLDNKYLGLNQGYGNTGNSGVVASAQDTGVSPQQVLPSPTYATTQQPSTGNVPQTTGTQFTTQPALNPNTGDPYSQNIGEAFQSLKGGHGLGFAPDVQQALLTAGLGMMQSKSPFALAGIGEGGLKGIEEWHARQDLERANANQRNTNAMTGADIQAQLANAASTQTTTANARTTFERTPIGLIRTQLNDDGTKSITKIPLSAIPSDVTPYSSGTAPGADTTVAKTAAALAPVVDPSDVPDQAISDAGYADLVNSGRSTLLQPATEAATVARGLDTNLGQMADLVSSMPDSGPLVMGADFGNRLDLVRSINTYISAFGGQPIDPATLASAEGLNKLATQLKFAFANNATSDPGLGLVQQAAAASPSGDNTKQGFTHIASYLMAINKRAEDRASFLNAMGSKNAGILQYKSGTADDYFNKAYPPQKYVAMGDAIDKAMLGQHITKSEFDLLPPELQARYAPLGG